MFELLARCCVTQHSCFNYYNLVVNLELVILIGLNLLNCIYINDEKMIKMINKKTIFIFGVIGCRFYGSNRGSQGAMIPVKCYENALLSKNQIFTENKNKSGIYRWVNKFNNNTYVGSGQDLAKRLGLYFKSSELNRFKRPIHSALLKYGHENFQLEILEYVSNKEDLIKREQFYIDSLTPEYNILKVAYSLAGYKHTDKTKANLKLKALERGVAVIVWNIETYESLDFLSLSAAAEFLKTSSTRVRIGMEKGALINSLYLVTEPGVDFPYESLAKIRAKGTIKVLNTTTDEVSVFKNQSEAAKFIGISRAGLSLSIKNKSLVKDVFLASKDDDFSDEHLAKSKPIKLFNILTDENIEMKSQIEVAKFLGVSASAVSQAIKTGSLIKKVYRVTI